MKNVAKILALFFTISILCVHGQVNRDEVNGDWAAQNVTLYNTPEADIMVRAGDIDNLGFGWPGGFDPFSGASTPQHGFPFSPGEEDVEGTDRIMVVTSYAGSPPSGQDGYTNTTSRPENLPRPIVMNYDLGGITIGSAVLQIFVDDFQAPVWHANYTVTLNGVSAPYIALQVNTLVQTGPIGKLITIAIPPAHFNLVSSGSLSILIDDLTTGAGDGYAIDFVKLLVNPVSFTYTGTISGTVTASENGNPIGGAIVSASGYVEATTNLQGTYTLENVPAGLINVSVSANGFQTKSGFVDLLSGQTATYNVQLETAIIPTCDTLHYPLPGTATLFTVLAPEAGYVCGNNTYGDLAKADYFEPAETGKYIYKGLFEFAYISKQSGQNPNIEFKVWDNSGNSGYPGGVLGTATLPLTTIFDDVVASRMTVVNFDPPVLVNGPFYLGVVLPTTTGDTLALISTDENEVDPGTAFEQWFDGSWHAFSESNSWNLKLTQGIYALYCDLGFGTGENVESKEIRIFPNPATEKLNVEFEPGTIKSHTEVHLFNSMGRQMKFFILEPGTESMVIPMEGLAKGLYVLTLNGKDLKINRKVVKL